MAEVTYNPVVYKTRQNADGTYSVKIRVTYKRKSAYLPTTEYAMKKDLNNDLEIKSPNLLAKLYTLIVELKAIESKIDPFLLSAMDVTDVVDFIRRDKATSVENFKLPFVKYAKGWISKKKEGPQRNYNAAIKSFCSFMKKNEFDISLITSSTMRRYEAWLIDKYGANARAVSMYSAAIATIHGVARREFNDNELGHVRIRNPFEFYTPPRQRMARHRALSVQSIQKLIDMRNDVSPRQKRFIDVCLLSFCLMGCNLPDIWDAKRDGDVIYYNRTKTRDRRDDEAEMRVRLEPVCKCIWNDMLNEEGEYAFRLRDEYKYMRSVTYVGHEKEERERIIKAIGADQLTLYTMRHSWATIAYSIGIDRGMIDDCLCHTSAVSNSNGVYVDKTWEKLWDANRKVLESFEWK